MEKNQLVKHEKHQINEKFNNQYNIKWLHEIYIYFFKNYAHRAERKETKDINKIQVLETWVFSSNCKYLC